MKASIKRKRNNSYVVIRERVCKKTNINLTMSSPISGVMLILLLLVLRVSGADAPSDLGQISTSSSVKAKEFKLQKN